MLGVFDSPEPSSDTYIVVGLANQMPKGKDTPLEALAKVVGKPLRMHMLNGVRSGLGLLAVPRPMALYWGTGKPLAVVHEDAAGRGAVAWGTPMPGVELLLGQAL